MKTLLLSVLMAAAITPGFGQGAGKPAKPSTPPAREGPRRFIV